MLRARYWHDEPDDDDQTTLALDTLERRDLFGSLPPGVKPTGNPAHYCQRLIADDVPCYGRLHYTTDRMGQTITECTRPTCGHVAVVPRVRIVADYGECRKCRRKIVGENAAPREGREPGCRHCTNAKNARVRAKLKAKQGHAITEDAA